MPDGFLACRVGEFATARGAIQIDDVEYIAALNGRGFPAQSIAKMSGVGIDAVRRVLGLLQPAQPLSRQKPLSRDIIWLTHSAGRGRKIAADLAQEYGLTFADLESPARTKAVAHARQHVMWELRDKTKLTLPQIGRLLGGRDHSTILHGIRAHEARLAAERSEVA